MLPEYVKKLMACFPNSFINSNEEFIAHARNNEYFMLADCKSEIDVKCKVIEWFSRAACKTEPYRSAKSNNQFHKFMLDGINRYLETNFDEQDMDKIYTYLGNCCHHSRTIKFIESGYDMSNLESEVEHERD